MANPKRRKEKKLINSRAGTVVVTPEITKPVVPVVPVVPVSTSPLPVTPVAEVRSTKKLPEVTRTEVPVKKEPTPVIEKIRSKQKS